VVPSQSSSTPLQLSVGGTQDAQLQLALHVRRPVDPQLVVQDSDEPVTQANPSSTVLSQSSSSPLHVSAGALQLPQEQPDEQVRLPVDPQTVVQEPVEPAQQPKPSSHAPLQSSSLPLQVSAGGEQTLQPQAVSHVREPVDPQLVVQLPLLPEQHAKVSSHIVSQSSSLPLQASIGGLHAPQVQPAVHVLVPPVPQAVEHAPTDPGTHAKPSSIIPSQSSSAPLQTSAGGLHVPYVHNAPHVCEPVEPQLVVHEPIAPGVHSADSSIEPSQSSSTPLHPSGGGAQLPSVHAALHVRAPVDPQLVVQEVIVPETQPKPSSVVESQSSSAPLHVSAGGLHALQVQSPAHVRVPLDPQAVVHASVAP